MPKRKDLSQRLEAVIKTLIPQHGQNADDLGPMMRAIKAVHSATDHTSTTPEDLEHQRAAQELFARLVTPSIGIRNDALSVNNIPAEWVSLEHGHDRHHAVLYCHGGGYTCGQLGYARILASKLALCTGFDVLSFEYRLAPENPYPAAVEDALAMWDYLMYMGYGARDIVVAGDSAGGNLALELCLKLKEQGRAQPRALLLFSPWTDMTANGKSYKSCKALDPMLTYEYIEAVRAAYTGPDADWLRCAGSVRGVLARVPANAYPPRRGSDGVCRAVCAAHDVRRGCPWPRNGIKLITWPRCFWQPIPAATRGSSASPAPCRSRSIQNC